MPDRLKTGPTFRWRFQTGLKLIGSFRWLRKPGTVILPARLRIPPQKFTSFVSTYVADDFDRRQRVAIA